jgi:hypothetical protein
MGEMHVKQKKPRSTHITPTSCVFTPTFGEGMPGSGAGVLTRNPLERSIDTEIARQDKVYDLMNRLDPAYRRRRHLSVKQQVGPQGDVPVLAEEHEGGAGPVLAEQGIYSGGDMREPVREEGLTEGATAGDIAEDNSEKVGEIMRNLGISEYDDQEDA